MSLCVPCREEGREQKAHHFLDREDGRGPVDVCRWHFKGLPYPAAKIAASLVGGKQMEGRMGRKSGIDEVELRKLYAQGLTDKEIGERHGMTAAAVDFHRRKLDLGANHKSGANGKRSKARAELAPAAGNFKRLDRMASSNPPSNGAGKTVQVRVEVLDAMWAGLEPEDKARLVNHLIEARGR